MIKEMKALSIVETKEIADANEGREDMAEYFKKFIKVSAKDAAEMRKELEDLDNHKIRQEHIAKIIDFLPEDASDINKIFTDVSLDEGEIKQITDVIAKHK